jgi:hypothetical protein
VIFVTHEPPRPRGTRVARYWLKGDSLRQTTETPVASRTAAALLWRELRASLLDEGTRRQPRRTQISNAACWSLRACVKPLTARTTCRSCGSYAQISESACDTRWLQEAYLLLWKDRSERATVKKTVGRSGSYKLWVDYEPDVHYYTPRSRFSIFARPQRCHAFRSSNANSVATVAATSPTKTSNIVKTIGECHTCASRPC